MMTENKVFVFFTGPIGGIGGAQLYVARKLQWLRSCGWRVVVFSSDKVAVVVDELKEFEKDRHSWLNIPAYLYQRRKRARYLNRLLRVIGHAERYYFQSHTPQLASWAELVAEHVGGTHLFHSLTEDGHVNMRNLMRLTRHKYEQGLFKAIKDISAQKMLMMNDRPENIALVAVGCSIGNVADCECALLNGVTRAVHNILILGRLEKQYVKAGVTGVTEFARKHLADSINLYVMGDDNDKLTGSLKDIVKHCQNIRAYWLGGLFPVPRKVFKLADVCIAGAGCAWMAMNESALCITVDANDQKAIGILGVTTNMSLFRKDEPEVEISEMLERVLVEKKYDARDIKLVPNKLDYTAHQLLQDSVVQCEYFDFDRVHLDVREWISYAMLMITGESGYRLLMSSYYGVIKIIKRIKHDKSNI